MALYFAYASNLDKKQIKRRCPNHELKGIAYLQGYTIAFTRCSDERHGGVADIVKSFDDEVVWGAVYELSDEDICRLDDCEGYPDKYRREIVRLITPQGHDLEVFTYVANKQGIFLPHKKYIDQIVSGAEHLDLPKEHQKYQEYIERLKKLPYSDVERKCPGFLVL